MKSDHFKAFTPLQIHAFISISGKKVLSGLILKVKINFFLISKTTFIDIHVLNALSKCKVFVI